MTKTFGYCSYNPISDKPLDELEDFVARRYGWGSGTIDYYDSLYYEVIEPKARYFFFNSSRDYREFKIELKSKFSGLVHIGPFYYLPCGAYPVID